MFLLNLRFIFLHTYLQLLPDRELSMDIFHSLCLKLKSKPSSHLPYPSLSWLCHLGKSYMYSNHPCSAGQHCSLCHPSPAAAAAKSLQSCPTLCDPRDGSPPGSAIPGILQARTRMGCHFLLQCMEVKSENEVAQSCPTLGNPMDCSLPGSSVHGICQARVLEWGAIAFSE